MIIVSQDKRQIMSFDNVTELFINCIHEKMWIRCETAGGTFEGLGMYETEERAKEVLQEIVRHWETRKNTAYYMPEK